MERSCRVLMSGAMALLLLLSVATGGALAEEPTLRFLVLGDWGRDGGWHQQDVADAMALNARDFGADFTISTGDNFYSNGVPDVDHPQWRTSFEEIYHHPSLQHPWYIALGNHDYRGSVQAQIDYSELSDRWVMLDRYFAFRHDVGDAAVAEFFVLDTNPMIEDGWEDLFASEEMAGNDVETQLAWLDSALAASEAAWKIVIGHHAIYSSGKRHGGYKVLQETVQPILERHGVQAYFNGHDHNLQHHAPASSTLQYFTSGAGSELQGVGWNESTRFAVSTQGFMMVHLSEDEMRVELLDDRGQLLYTARVDRDGALIE